MTRGEWWTLRLGDVCTKIGSGATPRGGADVYLSNGPFALIRSQNIHNGGFRREGLVYIGPEHARQLDGVEVCEGDVLLNITGDSVARSCRVDPSVLPARVNQHVAIVRPDPMRLDPLLLRYLLIAPAMQSRLLSWAGAGATRNALTKTMIEAVQVHVPRDTGEQRAIAEVLGALDDKIELNERTNATLDEMARALFKSWFVDFDPVRAKAEGRSPSQMDAATAALFPGSFEDSPLGPIPAGWRVAALDEMATFLNGLALQKYPADGPGSLPVIKISEMRKGTSASSGRASGSIARKYIVQDGDMLFSWSGSLEVCLWSHGPGALNQHLFKVTSDTYPQWLYYLWTLQHLPDFRHIAAGKATTMGHIQRHHLSDASVVLPDDQGIAAGSALIEPLLRLFVANAVESRTLAELRDALLPKLISGEIRVGKAAREVEAAV